MSEWQPIETAPKDSVVDLWCVFDWPPTQDSLQSGTRYAHCIFSDGEWKHQYAEKFVSIDYFPTHWMPLPLPPSISETT